MRMNPSYLVIQEGGLSRFVAHEASRYRAGLKGPLSEIQCVMIGEYSHPWIPPCLGKRGQPCLNGP